MTQGLEQLQLRLQYHFKNPDLLRQALTHRSFSAAHYERLEFLGDSVLGLAVSDMLYSQLGTLAVPGVRPSWPMRWSPFWARCIWTRALPLR